MKKEYIIPESTKVTLFTEGDVATALAMSGDAATSVETNRKDWEEDDLFGDDEELVEE